MKNHTQNVMQKLAPDPFIKNQNWSLFFITCPISGLPKYIKTKLLTTCFYLIQNFSKTKRGLELVYLRRFLRIFEEKYFSGYILLMNSFIAGLSLFLEIFGQYLYCNYLLPVSDVKNFEINLSLFIRLYFYMAKKSGH